MTDNKEFAKQMRENAAKNEQGNIVCSPELWEEIASVIERAIIPPCKVGDKVYWFNLINTIVEAEVIQIGLDAKTESGYVYDIPFSDFGKTVFLTKEEAEEKLKEREG